MLAKWLAKQGSRMSEDVERKQEPPAVHRDSGDERRQTSNEIRTSPNASLPKSVDEAVLDELRNMGGPSFIARMVDQFVNDATGQCQCAGRGYSAERFGSDS